MTAMLTADWNLVGKDTYYRKLEVYQLGWHSDINFENVMLAIASNGGPIAVVRDPKKFVQIQGGKKSIIAIYSGSGVEISSIMWNGGQIITLGWSTSEQLVCVQSDGMVTLYDLFGTFKHTFSMRPDGQDSKVLDAKIFNRKNMTGVTILTKKHRVYLVNNIDEPKNRTLSKIVLTNSVLNSTLKWGIVVEDREVEVLLTSKDSQEIYCLTQSETIAKSYPKPTVNGGIIDLSISPDSRYVALFTDTGYLWIGKVDFSSQFCEVELEKKSVPRQMIWCGSDAVVCYWPGLITLINRLDGDSTTYYYDEFLHLSSEKDGLRIFTPHQHELLQKVPPNVQKVLRINSTEPGCYLLEASKHFQRRSHRADEYIGLVKDDLDLAVKQCLDAATFEFDAEIQKMLMRAAQFGKCFIPDHNPDEYVKICRELRVLNALRDYRIGIPMTYVEMYYQSYQHLLDRLVARKQYYLAVQIAKYLRIPENEGESRILVHWACYKVTQTQIDWVVIAKEIADKIGYTPGIAYDFIATKASEIGRNQLAIKLLDYEPRANKQVPLLLKLREDKSALIKAIDSGDTDLVYTVILYMQRNNTIGDFSMTIRNFPMAQALYIKYCKEHSPQALIDIYNQEDDFNSQAQEFIKESLLPTNKFTRDSYLLKAFEAYKSARNDLNASFLEEAQKLSKHQRMFDEKIPGQNFINKSVHETLEILLKLNEMKLADKFRSDYKIPERRYWWLRIQILAEQDNWSELEKFSKSKKSPIGYGAFVNICLKYNKHHEVLKYLPKIEDKLKFKYYVRAGKYSDAADIAFQQKYVLGLMLIQSKCRNDQQLLEKVNGYLASLI